MTEHKLGVHGKSSVTTRIPNDILSLIDELCASQGSSRSDVVIAALKGFLLDDAFKSDGVIKAIARQNNQVARTLVRLDVLTESFLVFVAMWLERHPPITDPEQQKLANRHMAEGMARFQSAVKADLTNTSKTTRLYQLLEASFPALTAVHAHEDADNRDIEGVDNE